MNSVQSKKYGLSPDEIFKKSLSSERFRTLFNFTESKEQNQLIMDLIGMIRKNTKQKEENRGKI